MNKTSFPKLCAKYVATKKTLVFDNSKFEHIPNHDYYTCERLEETFGLDIQKVVFSRQPTRVYDKEELRGVFDWMDIKGKEGK